MNAYMKRLSTLFFVACLITLTAFAREISAEQSLGKAVEMINGKSYAKRVRGKASFVLVHTQKSARNGKALFYVFRNEGNGGFVITGGDDRANPVLGYTENGTYEQALDIPSFRSWLSSCEAAMQWLSERDDADTESNLPEHNIPDQVATNADNTISLTIPGRHYVKDASLPASVEPLLGEITWNQGDPYNRLCPFYISQTARSATGCVATAMAQVMKYWEWPIQGTGSNKYTSKKTVTIELEADFSQSVYDWDNMLDDYSKDFTDEQAYAVAKLMSDVGISVNMDYGQTSGTDHYYTTYAMGTYFGYNKGIQMCNRSHYTYAEWNNLLQNELAQKRPIVFGGDNLFDGSGHEFVIDGYNEDGNYHVNWGWGGKSNGYFDINYMDPDHQGIGGSNGGYPANQQANIECYPDVDGTSVANYEIIASYEPDMLSDGTILCRIENIGLAPYKGKAGYIAILDDELMVGVKVNPIKELEFGYGTIVAIPFEDLGVTPEMIGDKKCKIYPVFTEGDGYAIPLSKVAFQDYILFSFDADGKVRSDFAPEDNAILYCNSIEYTRDYAFYNVKAKAVITNISGPTFDRGIRMTIYDENGETFAVGRNFSFIDNGSTCELEFNCEPSNGKEMVGGKTYNVVLEYSANGKYVAIPGSRTTLTIKDPGPDPLLSFYDFALDKKFIVTNEELTVSFEVENTGGFDVGTFAFAVFREGENQSFDSNNVEIDLPTGTTTVTSTNAMNYDEGDYNIGVFARNWEGKWVYLNSTQPLKFTIEDPCTAITNVAGNTPAPGQYYDLQGRRIANPVKGIYIVNGKKVVK